MLRSEIVVALDLGTTKVCTLVGEVTSEDQVEILGAGIAPSTGMRKGVVVDIPATVAAIRESIAAAERAAGVDIAAAYVGITGEHLDSLTGRGVVEVPREIQEEHVQQARLAARRIELPPNREILHSITRQYIVDGQEGVRHPVGMHATRLEVETHLVTAATSFVENVVKCVERARVHVEEVVAEPLATGLAVLTDAERQLGTVVADIGGGTTDVALFADGTIASTHVIPVGGNHLTGDLAVAFRLDPDQAERVKLAWGTASAEDVDPEEYVEIHMIGEAEPREIPRRLLPRIIGPRMEQIFRLVREHVEAAAAGGTYVTTCVLSGGGSQLPGATEMAREILGMPVRIGRPRDVVDPSGQVASPVYATAVGLLHFGAQRLGGRRRVRKPRSLPAAALQLLMSWLRRPRAA